MRTLLQLCFVLLLPALAVSQPGILGLWEGKLKVGVEVRLIFNMTKDTSNHYRATMDIPEQGVRDLKVKSVSFAGDSIMIDIGQFNASYTGKVVSDSVIDGKFTQGMSFPLQLKKIKEVVMKVRPQTPVPPFPYKTRNITYQNADKSITYGATITTPNGKGPFPALILFTGSGLQNRDEEMLGHKPFAVIADHLTRNGFIVMRVDDRGTGETTGDVLAATTRDFANDGNIGINYLRSLKEVDKKNIGLIGHSEGGMIAQLIAAERSDIRFIILLAGPGLPITELMREQNRAILSKGGLSKKYIDQYDHLYTAMLRTAIRSDKSEFKKNLSLELQRWMDTTSKNIILVTTGIKDDESKQAFIDQAAETVTSNWFRYFLQFQPGEYLKMAKAHVLAINGDKDIQVISKSNLDAIGAALKQGRSLSYEVHELPGLNHLFQQCKKCTVQEYGELDETFSPKALDLMTTWMKKIVKK